MKFWCVWFKGVDEAEEDDEDDEESVSVRRPKTQKPVTTFAPIDNFLDVCVVMLDFAHLDVR